MKPQTRATVVVPAGETRSREILDEAVGWVIIDPEDGEIYLDCFNLPAYRVAEKIRDERPRCHAVQIQLVPYGLVKLTHGSLQ